ncbi:MAG: hypothetical protein IKV94_01130 [Clostridia bacterium]|nr:hypothetical protein [Clostridia bacterium]
MIRKRIIFGAVIIINIMLLIALGVITYNSICKYNELSSKNMENEEEYIQTNYLRNQLENLKLKAQALNLNDEELNNLLSKINEVNKEEAKYNEEIDKYEKLIKEIELKINKLT